MAGCLVEDAKAAYCALQQHDCLEVSAQSASANVATVPNTTPTTAAAPSTAIAVPSVTPLMINGMAYAPVSTLSTAPTTNTALFTMTGKNVTPLDTNYDFLASIAVCGKPQTSLDWDKHLKSVDLNQVPSMPVVFSASCTPIMALADLLFFLDTGVNACISPVWSDFKTLHLISPHPINSIGGLCIHAISIGTIDITISVGHKITLENVLFAPASKVQLISVLSLNCSGCYTSHFSDDSFWLMNSSGPTILHSSVHENCCLYALSLLKACMTHRPTPASHLVSSTDNGPTTVLYATCTPDIETWHRHLGHCNFGAIVNMA